jgi:hypothetical protein
MDGPWAETDRTPRAPFHELRVWELNQAYDRLLERKPHLYKFSFGKLLTGHLGDAMKDDIHINKNVGAVLWADMMLYYVSRLVSQQ